MSHLRIRTGILASAFSGRRVGGVCRPSWMLESLAQTRRACHYSVLELSPECTQEEVKMAYRTLAKKLHPDTQPQSQSPFEASVAVQRFRDLKTAYDCLVDEKARRSYDQGRKSRVAVEMAWRRADAWEQAVAARQRPESGKPAVKLAEEARPLPAAAHRGASMTRAAPSAPQFHRRRPNSEVVADQLHEVLRHNIGETFLLEPPKERVNPLKLKKLEGRVSGRAQMLAEHWDGEAASLRVLPAGMHGLEKSEYGRRRPTTDYSLSPAWNEKADKKKASTETDHKARPSFECAIS